MTAPSAGAAHRPPLALVGDGLAVPCVDGRDRPYLSLDAAASTNALTALADAVHRFLPWYSSVHRGAGFKSRQATAAYEQARRAALVFAGRDPDGDTTAADVDRFLAAVATIAGGAPSPVGYRQDPATGDYWPEGDLPGWSGSDRTFGASCSRG